MRVEKREGGAVLEEGEDTVGDFIDGEVFADVSRGGFPHKGAFGGVKLDQEGAMTVGRSEGRLVGDRLV